ncbi:MAG: leucine--tRNA ligase, partial [Candidatus Diapherotrites archaeon]|nr:leucine--tRNA ligase [Candidatus Diapherotrites archaeon]
IEQKWQKKWEKAELGKAERDESKPKFFIIFAYPGPSGYLHIGHMRGFSYTDEIARYKRMRGFNVLFPVGVHASGLPAVAAAKKVERGDKDYIASLKANGCSDKQIKKLKDPKEVVKFFGDVYVNEYWKKFGFICDWNRFTVTIWPDYSQFIKWQFLKLNEKALLRQGVHFGPACVNCGPVAIDASETDLKQGGTAQQNEYTLLKFKYNDDYLVAATLRPETVYGQTNMWVNPTVTYVRAKVDDEAWIMSKPCAEKLSYQGKKVEVLKELPGTELLGKYCIAPGVEREIIILPAEFADPNVGTGLVTCVPSDAPYDYIALMDLKNNKEYAEKFGLDYDKVKKIEIIPIIETKEWGDAAGKTIVEKMGIKSQKEVEKLEEATQIIYKAGFHTGKLNKNCGKYSGMLVSIAKDQMKDELLSTGKADIMYDLSEEVICRCGGRVVIKKIDDQWFIKYSGDGLTTASQAWAREMNIMPQDYKLNISSVLEWFQDRPCVRKGNWLGTKFPLDESWVIEPISDSTLYPIYYLISKYVNEGKLKPENLTESFFDYVFLGQGKAADSKVDKKLLEEIRKDILYWYPVDINLGGKEHKTVHFPPFIMNHVAILNPQGWPKGIFSNGWVVQETGKISKSKGGAQPIPGLAEKYTIDGLRLYYAHIASPFIDIVWDDEAVMNYRKLVMRIVSFFENLKMDKNENKEADSWLVSRMNANIKSATAAMDNYDLRLGVEAIFFNMYKDFVTYKQNGGSNEKILKPALESWVRMMTPFAPHIAEELWEILGNKPFVSTENWPKFDESKIDVSAEAAVDFVKDVKADIMKVLEFNKGKAEGIQLVIAPEWKFKFFRMLNEKFKETRNVGDILKEFTADKELKLHTQEIQKLVPMFVKKPAKLPQVVLNSEIEHNSLNNALPLLVNEFKVPIQIAHAEDVENPKVSQAQPSKPAIIISSIEI